MDFSQICRTCLSTEFLSPIFKEDFDEHINSAALCITTGVKISKNDGLPQNICEFCSSFLQYVENFKTQCQEAETKLLSMKETLEQEERIRKLQTRSKKQKKDDSRNCTTKKLKKLSTVSKNVIKEQTITRQSTLSKKKRKVTDTEVVKTDIKKLDEVMICNKRTTNKIININTDNDDIAKVSNNTFNNEYQANIDKNFRIYNKMDKLISVKNEDSIEKSDLDIHESEFETEFLDLSFESDTKDWFVKEDVLENSITNLKNAKCNTKLKAKSDIKIEITDENLLDWDTKTFEVFKEDVLENSITNLKNTKCNTKLKAKSDIKIEITDENLLDWDTKTFEDATKNVLMTDCDFKAIENNTKMNAEKVIPETNTKKTKLQKNLILDPDIQEMDNIEELNVSNGKSYNSKNQLFEIIGDRVVCKLCQKEMSKRSIVAHITVRHPGSDDRRAKCDFCDSYILKTKMKRHTDKMHGADCTMCMYCHREHSSREELIDHVTKCTQKKRRYKTKESLVQCDVCHKSMLKASLKTHQDVRHRGIKPVCEHCGRRMGNKLRLQEHLRARHGHDKLQCGACTFRTASHAALQNHMRRHRGERPFVCEQCGAKFHAAYLLTQHRHSHRTRRDIKCDQCPAAFKTNNHLLMHKQSCHNNNTYQCAQCGREFKCPQYLNKHVRAIHARAHTPA